MSPVARHFPSGDRAIDYAFDALKTHGAKVDAGHWQGVATEGKPDLVTKELLDVSFGFDMPAEERDANEDIKPNQPWAAMHFLERVGGDPTNPGEQYKNWPWWRGQDESAMTAKDVVEREKMFTHTYQERFWPRYAGESIYERDNRTANRGVRYPFGDLQDVLNLLRREPQTRQAYFPIFFPEDTGAVHGGRIPCSLGYHFLLRSGMLHCWYELRGCDAVRHFRDDLYLAVRLVQWVLAELKEQAIYTPLGEDDDSTSFYREPWGSARPGTLFFKAHSFHVHMGDYHLLP